MKKGKSVLIIILLCLGKFAFQQELVIEWQKTVGGFDRDFIEAVSESADGSLFWGATSGSNISGDKTEDLIADIYYDCWVIKTTAEGEILWQRTLGGELADYVYSIEATADGGCIVGARSFSNAYIYKSEDGLGEMDYWLIKLDEDGNIEWENTIGSASLDYLFQVVEIEGEGYYAGGYSYGDASGDKTENSWGDRDFWIVKLDLSGNIIWDRTLGGNDDDLFGGMDLTVDGGLIITGYSRSNISGNKTQNSYDESADYWLVRLAADGNIIWDRTIGGNGYDAPRMVKSTEDGGYIVIGSSYSDVSEDKSEDSKGYGDFWVVKTDQIGNIVWDRTFGGAGADVGQDVIITEDYDYIIGGISWSDISGDKTETNVGIRDYWLVKVNQYGELVWDKTYGGSKDDLLYDLEKSADGGIILVGNSESSISGDKEDGVIGGGEDEDLWLIKIRECFPVEASISIVENTLIAQESDSYQWVDCDNDFAPILGANEQSFTPTENCSYAVVLKDDVCGETMSDCVSINSLSISNNHESLPLFYPNPFENFIIVNAEENIQLVLYDAQGVILKRGINQLLVEDLPSGVYFVFGYNAQDELLGYHKMIKN
ncbi:MAG: T9SS type A sorting domain-containing protein [Flavobacteriales bacterium]|nr:T9SS type A sorting domain-containing protein [Flavobacteriales bacterium]